MRKYILFGFFLLLFAACKGGISLGKGSAGTVVRPLTPEEINKNAKGIKFKARGNNETYEVHLTLKGVKMPPWSYLSSTFNVSENWQTATGEFKEFRIEYI